MRTKTKRTARKRTPGGRTPKRGRRGTDNSMKATVRIKQLPPRTMMNLHHQFGKAEIEGASLRFCQHVNGACFWLSVDDDLYEVSTEDLMNSVVNTVMEHRKENNS